MLGDSWTSTKFIRDLAVDSEVELVSGSEDSG